MSRNDAGSFASWQATALKGRIATTGQQQQRQQQRQMLDSTGGTTDGVTPHLDSDVRKTQ
jgi:hypothetical protein